MFSRQPTADGAGAQHGRTLEHANRMSYNAGSDWGDYCTEVGRIISHVNASCHLFGQAWGNGLECVGAAYRVDGYTADGARPAECSAVGEAVGGHDFRASFYQSAAAGGEDVRAGRIRCRRGGHAGIGGMELWRVRRSTDERDSGRAAG